MRTQIGLWDSTLREGGNDVQVFSEVAEFLGPDPSAEVWQWIRAIARNAGKDLRIAMRIGLLELIPEEPRRKTDLQELWIGWSEESLRWMVYAAYHTEPRKFENDLKEFGGPNATEKFSSDDLRGRTA